MSAPHLPRLRPRAALCALLMAATAASAQTSAAPLAPSPAAAAEAAQPVRVVCIADSPEAFLRDDTFRQRVLARLPAALPLAGKGDAASRVRALIAPLGRRYIVPVGSGFVVDPERRHVVSAWQVVTACASDPTSGRQVGIVETEGADIVASVAQRLPERTFQDAAGNPVKLVQAVCRTRQAGCGADLPRGPGDKPLAEAERRRQLSNLLAYAPDLAVLRLQSPARTAPLPLALGEQLDDQMRLVVRAFGPVPVGATQADAAARQLLVAPVSVAAVYTGPQQISDLPQGGQPGQEIHVKLHRLTATVQSDHAGAVVLRGAGVVGVLTALLDAASLAASAGDAADGARSTTAYAVPVTVLANFLNLLKVPYVPLAAAPAAVASAPAVVAATSRPANRSGGSDPQQLMLWGAFVLAAVAAVAFFLLARRHGRAPAEPAVEPPPDLPPPQRTVSRVNQTLLHAVAMPTSALEETVVPPAVALVESTTAGPRSVPPPPARVHLHCAAGPLAPLVYSLPMPNSGTTMFIGRDARSCQVVFPANTQQVSAVHACFIWDAHTLHLTLRDLSSSGTWVNGARIAKGQTVPLAGGDQVDLGGPDINRFTVEMIDPAPAADRSAPP